MKLIADQYGRSFKTLRVSLLNKCNLGCTYCSIGDENESLIKSLPRREKLPADRLLSIIEQLHKYLQLKTIRLTGGEPLLYPELIEVIEGVKTMGIPEIKLTTNGFLLKRLAEPMKVAGMQSINVSLDAVDENVFFLISKRNNVQRILDGIDKALDTGLQVKINSVVMKGMNDSQVLPLLEYAFKRGVTIRFLEVMAMGHLHREPEKYLFPQVDLLEVIGQKYEFHRLHRQDSATANYWQTSEGFTFGIIANESEPFCHDCNRLRLDSQGNVYGCLSDNHPISLLNVHDDEDLQPKLEQALQQKQRLKFTGSELSMLEIGG
ncbi:MAG: radical SAM protein [Chitinophagaceae bacterium]